MTITIAPPVTTDTQYALSCTAPSSASTCGAAQASLLVLGINALGCAVSQGGTLSATVWGGDDATLPARVASFCSGSVSLGEVFGVVGDICCCCQMLDFSTSGFCSLS